VLPDNFVGLVSLFATEVFDNLVDSIPPPIFITEIRRAQVARALLTSRPTTNA
jgi:hypothetical protein